MKRSTRTGWPLSMMALSTLVACGDSGGEPSCSGGGNHGSTGTSMAGGGGSGGEAGGSSGMEVCLDICEQHKMYGCDPPELDCAESCGVILELSRAEGDDEIVAHYSCMLPDAPTCKDGPPAECNDEEDAVLACLDAHGCRGLESSYPNGLEGNECACASTCLGKKHEVQCGPSADGTTMCACLVDGVEVGTCEGSDREVCHLTQGCCQEFFNIP